MEENRKIECKCGQWENFPADMPRHKAQEFEWIQNLDNNEAIYKCPDCQNPVVSICEEVTDD